ncbi:MAG: AMP-binding protein [Eubacterium sp.]
MNNMLNYLIYEPMLKYGADHVINVFNNVELTYGYYANSIELLSNELKEINIQNEPVIVYMDDSPVCIICFLSLINIGAKPLIVSPKTIEKTLLQIIRLSKSRVILTEKNIELNNTEIYTFKVIENSIVDKIKMIKETFIISGSTTYLGLTSGSSGIPKIVMHSADEMYSAIYHYAKNTLKITEDDILFSVPKINFTYGLANTVFFSFSTGAKAIIYAGSLEVSDIIKIITENKVTYFFAVPMLYKRMYDVLIQHNRDISTVKYFISAGEYLPQKVNEEWFSATKKYIYDSVGCSETGSAYLVNMNPKQKPGSAGTPVEGYKLHLIDGEEHEGQLIVEGPSNAIGYLNDKENTSIKFRNKVIYTGDWFRRDEEDFYWFLGRYDDMIKKNGRWVSLNEISDFVKEDQNVRNAVTLLIRGKIVLIVDVNYDYDIVALQNQLIDQLEHYKVPDMIYIDTIPINSNGKIDLRKLKDKYEN